MSQDENIISSVVLLWSAARRVVTECNATSSPIITLNEAFLGAILRCFHLIDDSFSVTDFAAIINQCKSFLQSPRVAHDLKGIEPMISQSDCVVINEGYLPKSS
jgi:hypothetical protein